MEVVQELQNKAYCEFIGQNQNTDAASAAVCHFGIGSATSHGTASIKILI